MKLTNILLLIVLILSSCSPERNIIDQNNGQPSQTIKNSSDKISKDLQSINNEQDNINSKADTIKSDATKINQKDISDSVIKNADDIKASALKTKEKTENIDNSLSEINSANSSVESLESQVSKLKDELQNSKQEGIKSLYTSLKFFFGISFLAIMGGMVVAFFVDRKLGLSISGIGILGLALATGAVYYLKTIAFIGMIIVIASIALCVGLGILTLIKINKEKNLLKVANKENVGLIEDIKKNHLPEEIKSKIFGGEKSLAEEWQSPETVNIVKQTRDDLKKQGEI